MSYLSTTPLRARQVVQVMLHLGLVEVDVEEDGSFAVVRLAPDRRLLWRELTGTLELI